MRSGPFASVILAVFLGCLAAPAGTQAQPAQAAPSTAATPAPAAPATSAPSTAAPAPTPPISPPAPLDGGSGAPGIPPSGATTEALDIPSRPAAILAGKAKWHEGFAAIKESISKIKAAMTNAGLKPAGSPFTVFTETDNDGFSYQAMVPLSELPPGNDQLDDTVKLGSSPWGKAIKFQHRGPYDDIDSTYDLISAYLDEKDLEARDFFIEEYLTELTSPEDPNLAVDIYVFIK